MFSGLRAALAAMLISGLAAPALGQTPGVIDPGELVGTNGFASFATFDLNTESSEVILLSGTGATRFGTALMPNGNIVAATASQNVVQLEPSGLEVKTVKAALRFFQTIDVAVEPSGHIVVKDRAPTPSSAYS